VRIDLDGLVDLTTPNPTLPHHLPIPPRLLIIHHHKFLYILPLHRYRYPPRLLIFITPVYGDFRFIEAVEGGEGFDFVEVEVGGVEVLWEVEGGAGVCANFCPLVTFDNKS